MCIIVRRCCVRWSIATVTCSPVDVPVAVRNTSGRFVERFCVPVSWACCPTCRRTDPACIGAAGTIRKRAEAADSDREPSCRNERTAGSVALREPFGDAPARVRASIRGDLERDGFGHGWPGTLVSQCPQPVGQSHLVGLPLLGRGCLTSAATTAYRRQLDRVKKPIGLTARFPVSPSLRPLLHQPFDSRPTR